MHTEFNAPECDGAEFLNLKEINVLVYYDQPLIFIVDQSIHGHLLYCLVDENAEKARYLIAPITAEIAQALNDESSFRAALYQPFVWILDMNADGINNRCWKCSVDMIPEDYFPRD